MRSVLAALQIACRDVLHLDTNPVPSKWTHVTKIDPEAEKRLPLLYPLYLQHTDAISVGGSQNVDAHTTEETFQLLEWTSTPSFHEPSAASHVTKATMNQAEFLAIPEVLNGDSRALVGKLGEGVEYVRDSLAPQKLAETLPSWVPEVGQDRLADCLTSWLLHEAVFEAYIIQNPDSAAAREANVSEEDVLSVHEARRRAKAAEYHLGSEIIYLEYSGIFGDNEAVATLAEIAEATRWSRLWYGGGLASTGNTQQILDAGADAVVVGDVFHEIATVERHLCERAAEALERQPATETIERWLDGNVNLDGSPPVSYLETIPSVDDPKATALEYLVATIRTWMAMMTLAEEASTQDRGHVVDASSDGWLHRPELRSIGEESTPEYVRALVGAVQGDESDDSFPISHLNITDGLSAH